MAWTREETVYTKNSCNTKYPINIACFRYTIINALHKDDDDNDDVKLDDKHWNDHVPKSVKMSHESKVTILWNQQVRTDRTTPNNKADITIRDDKQGTCMLIDAGIAGDRIAIKKETEKILKYKDLKTEIKRMWNVKA
jgi:hypothetical protein